MPQSRNLVGVRSLKGFAAASAPGRVLDLHALSLDRPPEVDYVTRPLFSHPILNRSIIAKHHVRPGEESRNGPQRLDLTKIIFPFDPLDLELGGHGLFIDGKGLADALVDQLDYGDLPLDRDIEILRLFDSLPTLDPFLVREALAQRNIDVAACYFRFRPPDQGDMLDFVAGELGALVALCFGDTKRNDKRSKRMSNLLLSDQNSPELLPLRLALRMGPEEFSDAVFAWKGFLYYRWKARGLGPPIRTARRGISQIRLRGYDDDVAELIRGAKQAIDKAIIAICADVRDTLRIYDRAFRSLTDDKNPDSFRAFLHNGSRLFVDLGVRVGRLEQLVSFWGYRFSPRQTGGLSADNLLDALRDVLQEIQAQPSELVAAGRNEVVWDSRTLRAVAM